MGEEGRKFLRIILYMETREGISLMRRKKERIGKENCGSGN